MYKDVPNLCLSCEFHVNHSTWMECDNDEGGIGHSRSSAYAYLNNSGKCKYYKRDVKMKTEAEAKQWIIQLGREGKTFDEVCEITGYCESQVAKIWPVVKDTMFDYLKPYVSYDTKRKIEDSTLTWVDHNNLEVQICKVLLRRLGHLPTHTRLVKDIMEEIFQSG